jgi:hypothetical protein
MTRKPRNTARVAAVTAAAEARAAKRDAAQHVRAWYERRRRLPGYWDSTSPNTREEFEALIADLEAGV